MSRGHEHGVKTARSSQFAAGMDGQCVREPLVVSELVREGPGQPDLSLGRQISRQREIRTDVEAAVGALIEVGRIPELSGLVLRPRRMCSDSV